MKDPRNDPEMLDELIIFKQEVDKLSKGNMSEFMRKMMEMMTNRRSKT